MTILMQKLLLEIIILSEVSYEVKKNIQYCLYVES